MNYWRSPWQRQPPPAARPARPRTTAVETMLVSENFRDLPFGGHAGEFIGHKAAAPAPPPPPPLEIEPEEERRQAMEAEPPAAADNLTALERLKLDAGDDGYEPPAPNLEPPVVTAPLVPVAIPEVDWREEERQRALRDHVEPGLAEEQPSRYPPVRRFTT